LANLLGKSDLANLEPAGAPQRQFWDTTMVKLAFSWWRELWRGGLQPGSLASLVFAVICVGAATLVRSALGELDIHSAIHGAFGSSANAAAGNAFSSYYSATLVAALVGGVPAGILAAMSGALAGFWLFVPPDWTSHVFDWDQMVSALLFAVSSAVIIWAAKSYRDLLARLREEQDRRQLLNHELAHRIKNMLAIVQAVAGQTLRDQPTTLDKLNNRIAALAATNDLLIKSEWGGAFLKEILAGEFAPYDPARFALDGEDFECPSEVATVLALIFHELTTNAAKYGALSAPGGRVTLSWTRRHERLAFDWTESGGPAPAAARREGFGTTLLRKGLRQFDGVVEISFAPGGLRCSLSLVLPRPRQEATIDVVPDRPPSPAVGPAPSMVTRR
jgi:two-component sensor histidine kinase